MSHPMTSEESLTPDAPRPSRPSPVARMEDYRPGTTVDPEHGLLRRQVSTIIDAILTDDAPNHAEVREELRRHVAGNPGRPEEALLDHLISMSDRRGEAG